MVTDRLGPVSGPIQDYPDDDYDGADTDVLDGYGDLGGAPETRWRPAAAILGAVVAVGAIATAVIINSGDSATTKATVGPPVPPPLTSAAPAPKTTAPPSASPTPLPPETVTTLAPPPSASPSPVPTQTPTAAPPPTGAPPPVALNPRTVVYSVTGTKQLLDLVNVVYTDARGYPHSEFNVSLPWSKVIVLNPGVQTVSLVATSFYGQLNCEVVNAAGQPVVMSANNGPVATCAR